MSFVSRTNDRTHSSEVIAGLAHVEALFDYSRPLYLIRVGDQSTSPGGVSAEFSSLEQAILEEASNTSESVEDFVESLVSNPLWRQILTKWSRCDFGR